jgi:hypothetical protein
MLGYTLEDLKNMMESVGIAHDSTYSPSALKDGLAQVYEFLGGLWAEGYCGLSMSIFVLIVIPFLKSQLLIAW